MNLGQLNKSAATVTTPGLEYGLTRPGSPLVGSEMATQVETETKTMSAAASLKKADKKTFQSLSKEIKELVIEKVIRPSDLKKLCLVSKEWHELAVRFLYRNVALDLGSPMDNRLSAFISPKNIGLKHIKQLRLYLAPVPDRCNQEQQAHFATRMILEFLPEDILEEFSWCPWKPFSTENLLLLYSKQRKMKWLEVMDVDEPALPLLKKNKRVQSLMFKNARKLALYPENRETLDLSGYFVEKTAHQLEELIVHCNFLPDTRNAIESRDLNDSATAPGLVTSTIFRCMTPFDKCSPFPNLKSLRLHRVSLRYCADTWCKFINFHDLQALRLYHCAGADTLFGQLSKANHLPRQLKVLEVQHRDNAENEALVALDGFLCLVSGLRDLVIDLEHVKAMPAAAGIIRHGKTLELLNVHCAGQASHSTSSEIDGAELVWDTDDFHDICTACKDLEQLSTAWPHTSLIRTPSDEWTSFELSSQKLRSMVTLHITNWPTNKPSTQLLPRSVYEALLQTLAQRRFEIAAGSHSSMEDDDDSSEDGDGDAGAEVAMAKAPEVIEPPSRLRLIAFGTSDKIYEREDSRNQILYLKSTAKDAEGRQQAYAAPVGWCLRQFIEPRSEVLDFVLHKSGDRDSRPPCREFRDSGGWGDDDEVDLSRKLARVAALQRLIRELRALVAAL
ncbi:uncharacterized protein RCC_00386 [Ramularia collo-cygni]|uniref:F-box domain-containing protein n=1 Tax=Ramularia collo-cygni TaxID=112498 RepID=A0A2D3UYY4_9PEZI|nr:uncharacterized protein RCC_00386 [Ramularia collo-cygni]CZT14409.1 uncharacterized protein RCC_00386 [Ramularia collo-cygni]